MAHKDLQIQKKDAVIVPAGRLRQYVSQLLSRLGVSAEDAAITADVLVAADLRGVDSHGVSINLKRQYVDGLDQGFVNPKPNEQVVRESGATVLVDGDRGLGHPACYRAMELAIKKARQTGMGMVTIRNSLHNGMVGYYAEMAARQEMIGISLSAGGSPAVLPTYGAKPMLSTNPISIAAPAGEHPAFLLDMATSIAANGKGSIASLLDLPIPAGWTLDEKLRPTTDSKSRPLYWLPLGGSGVELGGHKGFGLGLAVDILCGVLSGHGYGAIVPRWTKSHTLIAIDIAAFRPVEEFKRMMDEMIDKYHALPTTSPENDRVYVAGEPEWEMEKERLEKGIPLHKDVHEWLVEEGASRRLNLSLT
jgi:LDH2 family malate/lactate/ureidoglycolate dehydrogenase